MKTYLFFRAGGFYPVQLPNDEEAQRNAEINPGTLRVETPSGFVVWKPTTH